MIDHDTPIFLEGLVPPRLWAVCLTGFHIGLVACWNCLSVMSLVRGWKRPKPNGGPKLILKAWIRLRRTASAIWLSKAIQNSQNNEQEGEEAKFQRLGKVEISGECASAANGKHF